MGYRCEVPYCKGSLINDEGVPTCHLCGWSPNKRSLQLLAQEEAKATKRTGRGGTLTERRRMTA